MILFSSRQNVSEIVASFVFAGASIKRRSMTVFINDSALARMMTVFEGIGAFEGSYMSQAAW